MEVVMRMGLTTVAMAMLIGVTSTVFAQSSQTLLVPGQPVSSDVPGAKLLPDPSVTYKVVFNVGTAAKNADDLNPVLVGIARYVNTLGKYGVPAEHRHVAAVFHRGGTDIIMNNDAYKASHDGHDNPNVALIQSLAKAGVEFHVCGQAVLGRKIDPKTIMPQIELDLWALTTFIDLERQGYVLVGGG
jgi:intracellular sulfur oxidation DsrE/DsrF family protein